MEQQKNEIVEIDGKKFEKVQVEVSGCHGCFFYNIPYDCGENELKCDAERESYIFKEVTD